MITALTARKPPMIIMGDFNCDWKRENSALRILARKLDLVAHQPEATDLITFPGRKTGLGWITISREFRFEKYEVISDVVSDHRAVVAEIGIKKKG